MQPSRQFVMQEIQLLLSEKQTSLVALRTGISIFSMPLSVITVLIATSKLYDVWSVMYMIIPLACICAALIVLAVYLIMRAIRRIRHYDAKIEKLRGADPDISALVEEQRV